MEYFSHPHLDSGPLVRIDSAKEKELKSWTGETFCLLQWKWTNQTPLLLFSQLSLACCLTTFSLEVIGLITFQPAKKK